MDFTIFGSCLIKTNSAIFVHFFNTHVRNISYFYLCVRRQHGINGIVSKSRQFENKHNENTFYCVTKTVTVGFFLSRLFYPKNSDNLFNYIIFNVLYLEKYYTMTYFTFYHKLRLALIDTKMLVS